MTKQKQNKFLTEAGISIQLVKEVRLVGKDLDEVKMVMHMLITFANLEHSGRHYDGSIFST